jgi:rod shape-determining protein MreC
VVETNTEQGAIYTNSFSVISSAINNRATKAKEFIYMAEVADSLARENSMLLQERDNAQFIKTVFKDSLLDLETEQLYTFTSAKVISNSIKLNNNSMTINRGTNHGVQPGMGVVTAGSNSVVGIVKSSTNNYSRILPVLHSQSSISSSISRNGHFGGLIWRGGDPTKANLVDIPKHADLKIGDTIQTSGFGTIFPEGIMVGTIDTFWIQTGTNFYEIKVNLSSDLSKVKYVYVVENLMREELEELEKEVSNE